MSNITIDPYNITDFNRTEEQLESLILFCLSTAGKTAKVISKALDRFLEHRNNKTPFQYITYLDRRGELLEKLKEAKLGKYSVLFKGYRELAYSNLDLRKCSIDDLEKISGIGMKTSRFFIVHSRAGQRYSIIDVHLLKHLKSLGYDVPKSTPTSRKQYLEIEQIFLKEAKKAGTSVAQFDLEIWNTFAK